VAAVNRIGDDGNGIAHNGSTMLINPRGEVMEKRNDTEIALHCELDGESLLEFRKQFPVLDDRDMFDFI